jgi:DNA-binding SARP family transcriptional activator
MIKEGDRMRPSPDCSNELNLKLFGGPVILNAQGQTHFPSTRKGRQLLAYLGLKSPQWSYREEILAALWPDCPEEDGRGRLDTEIWRLRKAIPRQDGMIETLNGRVRLAPCDGFTSDVDVFRRAVSSLSNRDHGTNEAELHSAIRVSKDVLCPGETAEWLLAERAFLTAQKQQILDALLDILEARKDWREVISVSLLLLAEDPLLEHARRSLMRAMVATGNRAAALGNYRSFRRLLRNELQTEPMHETVALASELFRTTPARPTLMGATSRASPKVICSPNLSVRLHAIAKELQSLSSLVALEH